MKITNVDQLTMLAAEISARVTDISKENKLTQRNIAIKLIQFEMFIEITGLYKED